LSKPRPAIFTDPRCPSSFTPESPKQIISLQSHLLGTPRHRDFSSAGPSFLPPLSVGLTQTDRYDPTGPLCLRPILLTLWFWCQHQISMGVYPFFCCFFHVSFHPSAPLFFLSTVPWSGKFGAVNWESKDLFFYFCLLPPWFFSILVRDPFAHFSSGIQRAKVRVSPV